MMAIGALSGNFMEGLANLSLSSRERSELSLGPQLSDAGVGNKGREVTQVSALLFEAGGRSGESAWAGGG
jgi:hypothetical protein